MRVRLAAIIIWVLVFASPVEAAKPPAQAVEKPEVEFLRCPDSQNGQNLKDFDILEGAPADKEYMLAGDDGWDLESSRSAGQRFYLLCHYGEAHPDVQLEIPPNLDFCKPDGDNIDCR